jgi:glycine cleavage system transcriptional repressor
LAYHTVLAGQQSTYHNAGIDKQLVDVSFMDNFLVITALGKNRSDDLEQLVRAIRDCGCNITESRLSVLGSEFALFMQLSGTWDTIAKIEDTLPKLEKRLTVKITSDRTDYGNKNENMMPYAIDVVALDHIGIVNDIVNFIHENKISIQDMYTNTYRANNSGTTMFSMHMVINIPANMSISAIRGEFMDFCDQLNLDAIMEPVKL